MNRGYIAFNLQEALDELASILHSVKNDNRYTEEDFRVAMEHLYHHINFAWNARNTTVEEVETLNDDRFYAWRTFPKDISFSEDT